MAKRPSNVPKDFNHPAMTYTKPKELKRFQTGLLIVTITLGVLGVWTLAWFVAQTLAQNAITDWVDQQRAQGADVGYKSLDVAGYPFNISLSLTNPRYQGEVLGQTVAWQGQMLTASVKPWAPSTFVIDAPGKHQLTLPDNRLNLKGTVDHFRLNLTPGESWPEQFAVSFQGLTLTDRKASAALSIGQLDLRLNHDVEAGNLAVTLNGTGLNFPSALKLPLGNAVESLNLAVLIDNPLTPEQLMGDLRSALPAWQSRDNKINVQTFKLRSGPLAVTTSGVMGLDEELQPTLDFTAKFSGLFQVLDIFRVQGLVSSSDAVIATMALSAFSKRPAGGGPASINLSVTAKKGTLKLGPITIARLPHFTWGIKPPEPVKEVVPKPRNYKDIPPIY